MTDQNIKRLLRWKDHRRLTEKILSGPNEGKENKKVLSVIKKTDSINKFRQGKINEKEFKIETEKIFPSGFVWQIFLFHITRPFEYPIADQNVFRTFSTQKHTAIPEDWEDIHIIWITSFKSLYPQVSLQKNQKGMSLTLKRY